MPQFDEGAADRFTAAVQDASAQVRDDAVGDGETVIQLDQVVVLVQGNVPGQRIVGSLGNGGGDGQRLGEKPGKGEPGGDGGHAANKAASIHRDVKGVNR